MKDNTFGVILIGLVILGGLYLLMRQQNQVSRPVTFRPINSITPIASGSYDNEEIREIEYNADGLPIRIVIHRHAAIA